MYNLLPEEKKRLAKREYLLRFLSVLLLVSSSALLSGAVFLFPSYLLSSVDRRLAEEEKRALSSGEKTKNFSSEAMRLQSTLSAASFSERSYRASALFDAVSEGRGEGVKIRTMSFRPPKGDTPGTISVSGTALRRDDLLSFKHRLEETKAFFGATVDLPVGVFAKSDNIQFTLTITGNFSSL